jgi:hypothetical protein
MDNARNCDSYINIPSSHRDLIVHTDVAYFRAAVHTTLTKRQQLTRSLLAMFVKRDFVIHGLQTYSNKWQHLTLSTDWLKASNIVSPFT